MATTRSENRDRGNSAQRYTVGFFNKQYGDDPAFLVASNERQNQELNYFNIADPDNDTAAEICAGLLIAYVEADSVPLHDGKDRGACLLVILAVFADRGSAQTPEQASTFEGWAKDRAIEVLQDKLPAAIEFYYLDNADNDDRSLAIRYDWNSNQE